MARGDLLTQWEGDQIILAKVIKAISPPVGPRQVIIRPGLLNPENLILSKIE